MSEFKLSEATHVCPSINGYAKCGSWCYIGVGERKRFIIEDDIGNSDIPIADLIPEPYTGTAEEFTLDCLRRDLDAHYGAAGGDKFFASDRHLIRYSSEDNPPSSPYDWHQMPTRRGTVSQDATNPKNRELAGLEPLQDIAVEKMIEYDQLNREDFDAGVRGCLKDIANICGASFGVDVGYESLPDLVKPKVAPETPEWEGEGLTPVGVEVEAQILNDQKWRRCKILSVHGKFAWIILADHPSREPKSIETSGLKFRPLRTDREKAIEAAQGALAHIMRTHEHPDEEAAMYLVDFLDEGLITGYGKLSEEKQWLK